MTEQAQGLLGSCALVPESGVYLHNQRIGKIDVNEKYMCKDFVYYLFQTKSVRDQIRLSSTGSKVKHTSPTKIYDVIAPIPSRDEQKRIAKVLSQLDKKIELNNKINTELEAMAKLIYDYWFVQFDFPDENGKPYKSSGGKMVYSEELKREIPDSWKVSDIAGVTELIKRGISPDYTKEEGLRVINQRCVRDQTIDFSLARTHGGSMCSDDPRVIQHWDVLVNSTGVGTLGRVAHVKVANIDPHVTDSHVTTLRASVSKITKPYFAYTLKRLQPVIEAAANGSTGQVELSRPYLEGIKFVIPEHGLQKKFGAIVSQISEKQALAENETQELTKLRDWLLPMLMNGQVTVE